MKTGFRVELSGDELSTVITACNVRLCELSRLLYRMSNSDIGRKGVEKKFDELSDVLRLLENAQYFIEMGA